MNKKILQLSIATPIMFLIILLLVFWPLASNFIGQFQSGRNQKQELQAMEKLSQELKTLANDNNSQKLASAGQGLDIINALESAGNFKINIADCQDKKNDLCFELITPGTFSEILSSIKNLEEIHYANTIEKIMIILKKETENYKAKIKTRVYTKDSL